MKKYVNSKSFPCRNSNFVKCLETAKILNTTIMLHKLSEGTFSTTFIKADLYSVSHAVKSYV